MFPIVFFCECLGRAFRWNFPNNTRNKSNVNDALSLARRHYTIHRAEYLGLRSVYQTSLFNIGNLKTACIRGQEIEFWFDDTKRPHHLADLVWSHAMIVLCVPRHVAKGSVGVQHANKTNWDVCPCLIRTSMWLVDRWHVVLISKSAGHSRDASFSVESTR